MKATLIDREGRREGWNVDRPVHRIPGCNFEYGSEDESAPKDTTKLAPADTIPGHAEPTPIYYNFTIEDSAGVPGLLQERGCEVRLDPEVGGHVTLAVTGTGVGFSQCQDTTSVTVKPGVSTRWWLSWKVAGERCSVSISRMAGRKPPRPSGR